MEQCNVCGGNVINGTGVFITGLIKGAGVFACQQCKDAGESAKAVNKAQQELDRQRDISKSIMHTWE